jgi:hypothetical protein
MVWIFALLIGLALVFFKLGSVSVWVGILTFSLKLSFLVIGFLFIAVIWQKWKAKRNQAKGM